MDLRAQILMQPQTAGRGSRMLEAMLDTAPIPVKVRETYSAEKDNILVTYGTGHAVRRVWWQQHIRRNGRCIGLDIGYWDRQDPDAGMRVTLDSDHPPQWIRPEDASRWDARGVDLRADAGEGPALVIGQGVKSVRVRQERPLAWEMSRIKALRSQGREVLYRPKRHGDAIPGGVNISRHETIDEALVGCSLVVCRHSNVAVDACLAGVPAVCEGGAASALYGNDPCNPIQVTRSQRLSFLRSLAWWNYRPSEAAQAWTYLLSRIQSG
ncbi:MAG: hypothetical protein M3Q42_10375 [Pseudomonadota bacterium]|nr:hypothetical protein [Pseudomonadota bacterium]